MNQNRSRNFFLSTTTAMMMMMVVVEFVATGSAQKTNHNLNASGLQTWVQQPRYQEVNPKGTLVLPCKISNKKGECRWERDGSPVGIYPGKYEWSSTPETGDCSLKITDANLEYDDGVWQCQVTASSFSAKDALVSEGAELIVREPPSKIVIQRVGDDASPVEITAAAGEDLELECIATGANPPAKLKWFMGAEEITSGHSQENKRPNDDTSRTWLSLSRLVLPISRQDNGAVVRCEADHPALADAARPIHTEAALVIHYPPTVTIDKTQLENLEDEKDDATLRCIVDSNPPASITWRKEGLSGIFSPEKEIIFSPVTRHSAGLYSCTAENALGLSKPAFVELDVKYSPRILSVGPSKIVAAKMFNKTVLTCEAEGNPTPEYQWLQMQPNQEVRIRGYAKQLVIENVTYDHQGEFVCEAINEIKGQKRSTQSDPLKVEVSGAPQILKYSAKKEVVVGIGTDAVLEVEFCANPLSNQSWHLGDMGTGTGNNIILAAGTGHGRFIAETVRAATEKGPGCYISALKINGAHPTDSHTYELKLSNSHGIDTHTIALQVEEQVSQESLIAVVVGCILTALLLILILIYAVKAGRCCCTSSSQPQPNKKDFKNTDIESDKTDVDSTHSSSCISHHGSVYHVDNGKVKGDLHHIKKSENLVIPPDALYGHQHPHNHPQTSYISYEAVFNDSKESLRPDLISSHCNLNSTQGSGGELSNNNNPFNYPQHQQQQQLQQSLSLQQQQQQRISYNDLCFPKTSNYGSMKKKKIQRSNVGVDCKLGSTQNPEAS